MKKPTEKYVIGTNMIEKDLKTLFRTENCFLPNTDQETLGVFTDVQRATQIFDGLRVAGIGTIRRPSEPKWTHPSVLTLGGIDPISEIVSLARRAVLDGIEQGWSGPPYNPFTLAEIRGIKLLPTDEVIDARTRSDSKERFLIEFNPQRAAARMRYSIAHEIGHTLFPDCAAETRHRTTHQEMKKDDWQLESLCNIAAAEILMPFGTIQDEISIRPSTGLVLELRRKYLASCEAVVNRLIKLTNYPCLAFLSRRSEATSRYFVEYRIVSPTLQEGSAIQRGYELPNSSKASTCVAIGARDQEDAKWVSSGKPWFIEYLGISPNTGEPYPRVLGLAFPPSAVDSNSVEQLRFLPGDASEPIGGEPKLLLQMVNDQALVWGGGFAKHCRKKWPHAQAQFRHWAFGRRNLKLGNIHSASVREDLILVSLVAQRGFGGTGSGPKLRYGALFSALEKVAELAGAQHATIHMPRIGTGDAAGSWNVIEGIIRETLISRGLKVTIYNLHSQPSDFPRQPSLEFPQEMADELI